MTNNRTKPDWGEAIFSEHCVIMRPTGDAAVADFIKYAIAVTRMHLQLARLAMPVQTNRCVLAASVLWWACGTVSQSSRVQLRDY